MVHLKIKCNTSARFLNKKDLYKRIMLKMTRCSENHKAQTPRFSFLAWQKAVLPHSCVRNIKDGICIQVCKTKVLSKRLDFSLDVLLDKTSGENLEHLIDSVWPPCWVSRLKSIDVDWSLIFVKNSSKSIAIEWKSTRLATLSRNSSESMRSSVSLGEQIFVMINTISW